MYRAVVLTTLLYILSDIPQPHRHRERFHQCCLRTILNIIWSDFVTNIMVLDQAGTPILKPCWYKTNYGGQGMFRGWRTTACRRSSCIFAPSSGHRDRGAPKKWYKDTLKKSLSACNLDHKEWSTLAEDRNSWRHSIVTATSSFESTRRASIEEKRHWRKISAATTPNLENTFPCKHCNRACRSCIGLVMHERAYRSGQPSNLR